MRRCDLAGDDASRCRRRAACRRRVNVTSSRRSSRGAPSTHDLEADLPPLEVRRPADRRRSQVARHRLHPDRLPDAGRARVPDRVRLELPVLLAARLGEVVRVVLGAHDDLACARRRTRSRDVERERRVAALVSPTAAVDPDGRAVVDGAEVEDQSLLARSRRELDRASIPAAAIETGIGDAARPRFGRKGHPDASVPDNLGGRGPAGRRIQGKVPVSIERVPGSPPQLRARIAATARVELVGRSDGLDEHRWFVSSRGGLQLQSAYLTRLSRRRTLLCNRFREDQPLR